jgi:glycosyltransferase involved in cell wall biosynthesis
MVALKNVDGILNAFHKLIANGVENVRLILIGNRNNLYVKQAEELGLLNKTVFFKGEISYRDVAEEMQQANCLIQNSLIENAPCVISEALCCGLPIITTMVGGIPEMVDVSNSISVPVKDDDALAIAMQKMIDEYPNFNQQQIAKHAASIYSYGSIAEKFDALYLSY